MCLQTPARDLEKDVIQGWLRQGQRKRFNRRLLEAVHNRRDCLGGLTRVEADRLPVQLQPVTHTCQLRQRLLGRIRRVELQAD